MAPLNIPDLFDLLKSSSPPFSGRKGSIVRIRVKDFMTHHDVVMKPGDSINLILGPNGTGKSTIVCAICIGLGGSPRILSRSNNLREYIRRGATSSTIEIELFNPLGANYIVIRHISANANKQGVTTQFRLIGPDTGLNGKKAQTTEIEDLLSSLNIQLDNLCAFMPQDRVQEFSKMDRVKLLKSTQSSLINGSLTEKHEELINLKEEMDHYEKDVKTITASLNQQQQQIKSVETAVQTFEEKQALIKTIAKLEGQKAWLEYTRALIRFNKAKEELDKVKRDKEAEEGKLDPLKREIKKVEEELKKDNEQMCHKRSEQFRLLNESKKRMERETLSIENKINELNTEFEMKSKRQQDIKIKCQNLEERIESLKEELEEAKGTIVDVAGVSSQIKKMNLKGHEFDKESINLKFQIDNDQSEINTLKETVRNSQKAMERLEDLRTSRLTFLEKNFVDVFRAIELFSKPEYKAKFTAPIHEPMILHVAIKDVKYGSVLEQFIGMLDLTAFYCENNQDMSTFLQITSSKNLRVSCTLHEDNPSFEKPDSVINSAMRKKYGFTHVLIDMFEAPDYYMSYICKRQPENTPFGRDGIEKNVDIIGAETNINQFFTESYAVQFVKSYYSKEKTKSIGHLSRPRVFTKEINIKEVENFKNIVKDCQSKISGFETDVKSNAAKLSIVDAKKAQIIKKINELKAKISRVKDLENSIGRAHRNFDELQSEITDLDSIRKESDKKIFDYRMKQLNMLEGNGTDLEKTIQDGFLINILKKKTEIKRNVIRLQTNRLDRAEGMLKDFNSKLKELDAMAISFAENAQNLKIEARNKTKSKEPPKDFKPDEIDEEDLSKELSSAKVKLDFLDDANEEAVQEYHERRKKIEKLTSDMNKKKLDMATYQKKVENLKKDWLDPLNEVIYKISESFSNYFSSMQCAGEVLLAVPPDEYDFANYGIKIKVKFRSTDEFADLEGFKQSGGERAITTALYILSLQELTSVPFRVIDEINQGMDSKNEARFFKLLFEQANMVNASQYFILTPKQIPKIDYPDHVLFHQIFNGPRVET